MTTAVQTVDLIEAYKRQQPYEIEKKRKEDVNRGKGLWQHTSENGTRVSAHRTPGVQTIQIPMHSGGPRYDPSLRGYSRGYNEPYTRYSRENVEMHLKDLTGNPNQRLEIGADYYQDGHKVGVINWIQANIDGTVDIRVNVDAPLDSIRIDASLRSTYSGMNALSEDNIRGGSSHRIYVADEQDYEGLEDITERDDSPDSSVSNRPIMNIAISDEVLASTSVDEVHQSFMSRLVESASRSMAERLDRAVFGTLDEMQEEVEDIEEENYVSKQYLMSLPIMTLIPPHVEYTTTREIQPMQPIYSSGSQYPMHHIRSRDAFLDANYQNVLGLLTRGSVAVRRPGANGDNEWMVMVRNGEMYWYSFEQERGRIYQSTYLDIICERWEVRDIEETDRFIQVQ